MYPHERALVKRLANQPFALIGVNSDSKERALEALERENISWRSFFNGGSTRGPISGAWGVHSWPTIYVIDDRGVIRFKNVRGEAMNEAVDELLERAIVTLVENVKSDDPQVRSLAAFRMGKYDVPDASDTLKKLVKDENSLVRQRAATGLALLGEPAKPLLPLIREATGDDDAEVRVACLEMLGAAKDKQATALATKAIDDEDVRVRRVAVTTLGQLGDPAAAPALAKAVGDADLTIARNAAFALADLNAPESTRLLQGLAEKADLPARVWVAVALCRAGDAGTENRFRKLLGDDDVKIRRQMASALTEVDQFDPTDLLITALEDDDSGVWKAARTYLAKSDAPRAREALKKFMVARIDKLLPLLASRQFADQRKAQSELAALGPEAAPLLLPKMEQALADSQQNSSQRNVAYNVARVIGTSGNADVIPPVVAKLKQSDLTANHRVVYETVLRYLGTKAFDQVKQLAKDPESAARLSGVRLLSSTRSAEAVGLLTSALEDTDLGVRTQAAYVLARNRVPKALDVLKEALKEGDMSQRQQAMYGITYFGEETAVPLLIEAISRGDKSTRMAAISGLGRFRGKEATAAIVKAAGDDSMLRRQAAYALGSQRTVDAAIALGGYLKDKDESVRRQALRMLQNIRNPEAQKIVQEYLKKQQEEKEKKDK